MDMIIGAVSVSLVMILALYGLARLVDRVAGWLFRPRHMKSMLVLCLEDDMTDAEHQLRAAQYVSVRSCLPLYILDRTSDEELRHIVSVLLMSGVGEMVDAIPPKKTVDVPCDEDEDCV